MKPRTPTLFVLAILTLIAGPAFAHPGAHPSGLVDGLIHPFTGLDHLLATLGLGLVAGVSAKAASGRRLPGSGLVTVLVAALLGGLAGMAWMQSGAIGGAGLEAAAALSLLAIAVALLGAERLGGGGLALIALAVAVPHGALHASEGSGVGFFIGLALASAALFAAGMGLTRMLPALRAARRWAAAGYTSAGLGLLAAHWLA